MNRLLFLSLISGLCFGCCIRKKPKERTQIQVIVTNPVVDKKLSRSQSLNDIPEFIELNKEKK